NSYGDHRIAIAFAIAGLLLKGRSIVKNFHVYRDSYPTFLQDIKSLGGRVELKC
ncbi:MAG TPA: 3-phosphoshikimate 1-carboxyvinyltransferase, partial [Thermoprotei archaeon]|nr:3-phosphoshikimate 1-carboxyvinyltransferase [Thermoprotei archaeon]